VKPLQGVSGSSLDPITNQMRILCDPTAVSVQGIQKSVSRAGVKAVLLASK